MRTIKEKVKQEILIRLRMEYVQHLLPNKLCFYGHLIADTQYHPAWGAYRYPSGREFSEFIQKLRKMGYEMVPLTEYFKSPPHRKTVLITFDDGYAAIRQESHAIMKSLEVPYAIFIHPPGDIPPSFPIQNVPRSNDLFMSQQDIIDLKQDGVHIGFHGNSHQNLARTTDKDIIVQHISPTDQVAKLLSDPLTYAYPYEAPQNYQQYDQILMEYGFQHIMDTRGFGSIGNHHFRIPLDIGHSNKGSMNACEYSLLTHFISNKSRHRA